MSQSDFVLWLEGFLDGVNQTTLDAGQLSKIREKLSEVVIERQSVIERVRGYLPAKVSER